MLRFQPLKNTPQSCRPWLRSPSTPVIETRVLSILSGHIMPVVHFQCPSCQAPLRLENRALFVGRTFDCPDCGESLLIEADGSTGVKAKRSVTPTRRVSEGSAINSVAPSPARPMGHEAVSKVSDRGVDLQSPMSAWDRLSHRPALWGWIVAALFAVVVLVVVNSGRQQGHTAADTPVVAKNKALETAPQESAEQNSKTAIEPAPDSSKPNDQTPGVAANTEAAKPNDNSEPPPPAVSKDSPRDSKPPAAADAAEKPAAEELKPVPVPPPPEPVPASLALSAEAIEAKLRQKIARFDQPKPVAFVKLLDTIEELAGVPIVWDLDRVTDEQLQQPVTIRLKETTVGEILDTLLKQAGLERRTVEGKIELLPRSEAVPRP